MSDTSSAPHPLPPQQTGRGWALFGNWKPFLENALVAAVVSALVSGLCIVWLESRLENSKQHVAAIIQQKDKFESAQSNIFSQLGLYTGKLFEKPDQANKDPLQSAIIATLLQVSNLKNELPRSDHDVLDKYANDLEKLSKQVREVKTANDLGPIYASAQTLLELHDQIDERINANLEVSIS